MKEISEKTINAWIDGDQKALAEVTTAIYPFVADVCARILGRSNKHEVDDIVQNVMVKILQNKARLKDPLKIKSFIYVVVKNTCMDYFRKSEKNIAFPNEEELLNREASPEQKIINKETIEHLMVSIDSLPLLRKQILLLRYVRQENVTDVCEILGISERTFFNHLKAAKIKLEEALKHYKERE